MESRGRLTAALVAAILLCGAEFALAEHEAGGTKTDTTTATVAAGAAGGASAGTTLGATQPASAQSPNPCSLPEVTSSPSRPNWSNSASTTQCGVVEMDSGFIAQPMGGGVGQRMAVSSIRYGLTPTLQLRWGVTGHMAQSGGTTGPLEGLGDQTAGATWRFHEQGAWMPALAVSYAYKIPIANPAKGFGSGFADHQFLFIASRDLGKNHFDFNTAGVITGQQHGRDGAAQFGLALTRPITSKLSGVLESYGGPQPDTPARYGAMLTGASYTLCPSFVLDGAYVHAYTGGAPRSQLLFGFTYAMRPWLPWRGIRLPNFGDSSH